MNTDNPARNDTESTDESSVAATARKGVDKVETIIHEKIDVGSEKIREALTQADSLEGDMRESAEQLARSVGDYINRNPVQSAGFAFAAGVLTALILSRR
ncbi:MAG: hypothetical protein CSB44_08250 [Gammaproteobacteria bacterium]|nr:MAG: hypothetical protein CSB44_08250 [Gammaproteobacteria bacterium]